MRMGPYNQRQQNFGFIEINDGSFFKNLQVVFDKSLDNYSEISHLNIGSALRVKGRVVETPQAKQPYEIKATEIVIEGKSTPDYPCRRNAIPLNTCVQLLI